MMSDSDSENGSPVKGGSGQLGQAGELEQKLAFLKNACPNVDNKVLQETLRAHNGKVDWALETLTKEKPKPTKHKLKAHHVMEDNSESDDDDQLNRRRVPSSLQSAAGNAGVSGPPSATSSFSRPNITFKRSSLRNSGRKSNSSSSSSSTDSSGTSS